MADRSISGRLHSAAMELTADERSFIEQRWIFLKLALQLAPTARSRTSDLLDQAPAPVDPVIVERLELVTDEQCQAMAHQLTSGGGVVHVVPEQFPRPLDGTPHPLLALAARLRPRTGIGFPIPIPQRMIPKPAGCSDRRTAPSRSTPLRLGSAVESTERCSAPTMTGSVMPVCCTPSSSRWIRPHSGAGSPTSRTCST